MPRHIEIYIDDVPLSSVGPFIVQEVHEDPPAIELTEGERPGRSGLLLLSAKRQTLKVAAEIAIREVYDLAVRAAHRETLTAWAHGLLNGQNGGRTLRVSNHPDRHLTVACTADPALGPVRDFTAVARAEFTAYQVPFWESNLPAGWTMTGVSGSSSPIIPGTARTPVLLTVTPSGGTLTTFTATLNGDFVALTGLSVPAGSSLTFARDPLDNLLITAAGASVLSRRTQDSADDLIAAPGLNNLSFSANTACEVQARVYARWR